MRGAKGQAPWGLDLGGSSGFRARTKNQITTFNGASDGISEPSESYQARLVKVGVVGEIESALIWGVCKDNWFRIVSGNLGRP